ncbi:MAG: MBL fold metallo-hydrolase [Acidiferrobacterales bacterium]
MTRISFHGAAEGVTGSCFLVETNDLRILVDCGMFQGGHELEEENHEPFGFVPSEIDFVLLTHAHLDHCGRLPLLVAQGFEGEIITTSASREWARLVMLDAAYLNEEEAERRARWGKRHGNKVEPPLYTTADALNTLDCFGRTAKYDRPISLTEHVRATYVDAGHILGSASILLEIEEKDKTLRLMFSGDLGNSGRPVLRDPTPPPEVDYVVMETTYGDRDHPPLEESVENLYRIIEETFARGGNVFIPTFALERSQEVLYFLHEGIESGRLPGSLQVFLDSPMAISATEIFRRHPECFDHETADRLSHGWKLLDLPGLHFTRTPESSMAINNIVSGAVVLAGSGMCTGGRIRHHLKHNLWREQCSIIFVGFAAPHTLGRRIIEGAERVRIFGEEIQVRAQIHTLNGFSAHADHDRLLAWHRHTGKPRTTFLVHGDPERGMAGIRDALKKQGHHVVVPHMHQAVELD